MPWLTPDHAPTDTVCRRVFIPNDEKWVAIVSGALVELTRPHNWELFGDITPEQAADRAQTMFLDFLKDQCMVGAIFAYATETPPEGCIPCDGGLYDRAEWPLLYSALDSVFVVDADTFRTPDLRGRTLIGAGHGDGLTSRALGDIGGEEQHQLTVAELAAHKHTINQVILQDRQGALELSDFVFPSFATTLDTNETGGDQAHNNMQPWLALNYCMVAR